MKAERRHELQTNELAQWLNNLIEQVKPHANMILIGAIALVAIIFAVVYLSGRSGGRGGPAWDDYYRANAIEEVEQRIGQLEHVDEDHPGTPAALWAKLMAADARLLRGTTASFKDHPAGEKDLEKAKDEFLAVISGSERLPKKEGEMLNRRATWCLARTYEALADREKSIEQYEKLAKTAPDSALGKVAAERVKYLDGMGDWFEWYANVDPTQVTPTPRQSQGGLPPGHPGISPSGGQPPPAPGTGLPPIDILPDEIDLGTGGDDFESGPATPNTLPSIDDDPVEPGDSPASESGEAAPAPNGDSTPQ